MDRRADEIAKNVFELNQAMDQYLLHPEERPKIQFQLIYDSVGRSVAMIQTKSEMERGTIKRIHRNHEAIGTFFRLLVSIPKDRTFGKEDVSSTELQERAIGQLLGRSREIVSDTFQLATASENRVDAIQERLIFFILAITLISGVAMAILSYFIGNSILKPMSRLQQGTAAISSGNLDYQIGIERNDEIGQLSKAFNEMTKKLGASYVSLKDLQEEIVERKRAEEALGKSENDYRTLSENLPGIVYRVFLRENSRMQFFNNLLQPMTGYTAEELSAGEVCSIEPFILSEDRAAVVTKVKRAILDNQLFEVEYRLRGKGGDIRYFLERGRPIYGANGEPLYIDGVIFDITVRKQMEEELRRSHEELERQVRERTAKLSETNRDLQKTAELLERLFFSIDIMIACMDKDFNFLRVNRALAEDDGRDPEFFVGKNLFDLFPTVDKEDLRKVVETGESISGYEKPFSHPEHPERRVTYWDWGLQPVKEPDGKVAGVVLSFVNVTERKLAEETLRESESRLRHLSSELLTAQEKERKRIAGELHDSIAASLTAVKFSIENILSRIKKGTGAYESLSDLVLKVQQTVEETRRIMSDLRPSVLDDLGIIPATSWFCREFQKIYSGIRIEREISIEESDVPDSLKTPVFRISQEALNNIAKHSKADLVNLRLRKMEGTIELIIDDNGQGFDLNQIVDEDGSKKGLGLVSMRERAELSGGSFTIESVKGEGTTIKTTWSLPRK